MSPLKALSEDNFLHLIQVGDREVPSMVNSEKILTDCMAGLRFEFNSKKFEILFTTQGAPGGRISIIQNGNTIRDKAFTNKVKPQVGLF